MAMTTTIICNPDHSKKGKKARKTTRIRDSKKTRGLNERKTWTRARYK